MPDRRRAGWLTADRRSDVRRNLAVQFHPEVGGDHLAEWLGMGGAEALAADGIDAGALLTETRSNEADAFRRCDALVDWFLDEIATAPAR